MKDQCDRFEERPNRKPWNKGKVIVAKPPLRPKLVWSGRSGLSFKSKAESETLYSSIWLLTANCAAAMTPALEWKTWLRAATPLIEQRSGRKKTGHPVKFELTEHTRQAIDVYLKGSGRQPGEFLLAVDEVPA